MGAAATKPHESIFIELTETEKNEMLEDLVQAVMADNRGRRKFDLDATKCAEKTKLEIDKNPEDLYRPLKSVATDLVVNEFFKTDDTLYRFLTFVYTTLESALNVYRRQRKTQKNQIIRPEQLFFIYKGGNLLRIVSKEFLLELPASATREIANYYAPFFKRGDADYSIYIDPRLENYDQVYHEITLLAYLVQDEIRSWFSDHLMRYFNLFQYNPAYQAQVLFPYLEKFNEADPSQDKTADPYVNFGIGSVRAAAEPTFAYESNPDVTIRFDNPTESWLLSVRQASLCVIKDAAAGDMMAITHNSSLEFPGGGSPDNPVRIKFNLTRTKFIFTLLRKSGATENVGGELIDVSIPHRDDDGMPHFYDHLTENLTRYTLRYQGVCKLSFIAYSLPYLTYDLENILFGQRAVPWDDNKYGKRINRLIYMYFIDIFIALEDSRSKKEVLENARDWVFAPMESADFEQVLRGAQRFLTRYNRKPLLIKQLIIKLGQLTQKMPQVVAATGVGRGREAGEADDEYAKLGSLLVENVTFLLGALNNVQEYCSLGDGRVDPTELYSADISSLV